MKKIMLFAGLTFPLILAGCSADHENNASNTSQQPPVLEYKLGSNDWDVITSHTDNKKILEAYQIAVEHPEILDYMPCYCGCYEEDGHENNTDCFVDEIQNDVAKLDTMGFG
ncbi:PCYCGC domain-containing protein [Bacillus aquiflavi]|nr:PCYCGC domain-containing protein [Bacillus aquiflavi]